ncbi:UNVERIFIED_ORG: uncharacterized ferritin-like protein (DUF455 family) [Burkholderia contaminans]|nr:uncharacterized ferritin-like protein (DUF455 family) [Burkholderia contaminans]
MNRALDTVDEVTRAALDDIWSAIDLCASMAITSPAVEAKILFGEHLFYLTNLTVDLVLRRKSLLFETADDKGRAACRRALSAQFTNAWGGTGMQSFGLDALAKIYAKSASTFSRVLHDTPVARIVDEPSLAIFQRASREIRRLRTTLSRFTVSEAARLCCLDGEPTKLAWEALPEHPARDNRFTVGDPRQATGSASANPLAMQCHGLLTSVEISTIEACAQNILEPVEMPISFVCDMGRQAYEESRHARALVAWLADADIPLGSYEINFDFWNLTSRRSLVDRLCIHQRLGETTGAGAALWWSDQLRKSGDLQAADMYDFVYRDEIGHVAIGNKWIRYLCGDETSVAQHVEAARVARVEFENASGVVNSQRRYSIPRQGLIAAGYSEQEVGQMLSVKD